MSAPDRQSFALEIKRLSWVKWDKWMDPKFSKTASKCVELCALYVLMTPSHSVTVYASFGVAEFSSRPLEPWQRQFLKVPGWRGADIQCGRAKAQGAQVQARGPVSAM